MHRITAATLHGYTHHKHQQCLENISWFPTNTYQQSWHQISKSYVIINTPLHHMHMDSLMRRRICHASTPPVAVFSLMHAIIRRLKTSPSSLGLCGKQQEVFVVNAVNPQHVLCPSRNFQGANSRHRGTEHANADGPWELVLDAASERLRVTPRSQKSRLW